MKWEQRFKEHTTNVAFHLMLSKRMVYVLESIALNTVHRGISEGFGHFVPAVRNLIDRGLVEHVEFDNSQEFPSSIEKEWAKAKHNYYKITPAGEHVISLLQIAGLISPIVLTEQAA